MRYRRALRTTLRQLHLLAFLEPELLVEGGLSWLLTTVEGVVPSETAMAVGLVVDGLPHEV